MDLNEYQALSGRTEQSETAARESIYLGSNNANTALLLKNALGLAGEAGETVEMIKKHVFHGKALDKDKLKKELGDVFWYLSQLGAAAGLTLEEIGSENIAKLKARYPEGYSHEASAARVDGG